MDKDIKEKWVKALRSGEYKQGKMNFEAGGAFCCLGVLCKVTRQPTMSPGMSVVGNWEAVEQHLTYDQISKLYKMNDGICGVPEHSFTEIADYIEANL